MGVKGGKEVRACLSLCTVIRLEMEGMKAQTGNANLGLCFK